MPFRLLATTLLLGAAVLCAQAPSAAHDPLLINSGRIPPAYPVPYPPAKVEEIKAVLDRVLVYAETASPVHIVNPETEETVTDLAALPARVASSPPSATNGV